MSQPITYRVTLAYDGRAFAGFARQPNLRTVEGLLRPALEDLGPRLSAWVVAGRTDRGVSALGQVISFRLAAPVPPARIAAAIEDADPSALWCSDVRVVPRRFHARFSARARRYLYLLPDSPRLSVHRLDQLVQGLVGRRCFSAYARDTKPGRSTVRTLIEAGVRRGHVEGEPVVAFHFLADAFLRRQIRVTVATALREAQADAPPNRLAELAAGGDRLTTAPAAPPEGLRLERVLY